MLGHPTLFVAPLRKNHRKRLETALRRSREAKFRDRCRAVLWSSERRACSQIAALLGVHHTTVMRWLHDYRRFGFEGLKVGKSPGRPRKLDVEAEAALEAALAQPPRELGYAFNVWTATTLAAHLGATVHIRVHPETVRRALRRLGYGHKRPKLSLKHKQDRKAVRRARQARDAALKKRRKPQSATPSSSKTSANAISIPA